MNENRVEKLVKKYGLSIVTGSSQVSICNHCGYCVSARYTSDMFENEISVPT